LTLKARVIGVEVRRADVIARASVHDPAGRARTRRVAGAARIPHAELLVGSVVTRVLRRGKQLAIVGEGADGHERVLMAHLGMTGHFIHAPREKPLPQTDHVHVVWRIARAGSKDWTHRLAFRDPRRFGGLTTFPSVAALEEHWSHIGPDALALKADDLAAAARGSRRAIKALLLDQRAVAGVGNIYADEALFDSGIDPRTHADVLPDDAIVRLSASIRRVLASAIAAGGSTIRDYTDADGAEGSAQNAHLVYGRAGEPCVRCGGALSSGRVSQRATVWCPTCQPAMKPPRRAKAPRRLPT
jgi:formamidopyrimidine-DNA glycosylase